MSGRQPRAGVFNIFEGSQSIQHIPALLTNGAGSIRLRRAFLGPLGLQTSGRGSSSPSLEKWDCRREDRVWCRRLLRLGEGSSGHLSPPVPSGTHRCLHCWLKPCKGWASMLRPACPTCATDPSGGKAAPAQTICDWRNPTAFSLGAHTPLIHVAPVCDPVLPHCRATGAQGLPMAGSHLERG